VRISFELISQTIEVHLEVCNLRLLRLSIAVEGRVAEIDVADGQIGSCVCSRIGVWSGTLIGGGHLVMKIGEMIESEAWDSETDIASS
jgi:hypothetical protein